jgi:ethanolamine utilization protein EutA
MHDMEFDHEHEALTDEEKAELARYIWAQETVELKTVGIDIGSSTSHLLFAKVVLQRQTQGLSSRFVVIERSVQWRSDVMLTPFLRDDTIDAAALGRFISASYDQAGLKKGDVDSGAVILTGEAIKRKNARAIDELFAEEAGKFVCATAGHKLECLLAAHGSGAVQLSKDRGVPVLHVDIGGGTTKLALIDKGVVLGVAAFAVGGRCIATDANGAYTRVDDSAVAVAKELGLDTSPASLAKAEVRQQVAARLAKIAADYVLDHPRDPLGESFLLTEPLPRGVKPALLTFSGGVSEYIFGREPRAFGDIAQPLATELIAEMARRRDSFAPSGRLPAGESEGAMRMIDPGQGIRATVIGASQFTVQVSGKTVFLGDTDALPVHNVPVVQADLELGDVIDVDATAAKLAAAMSKMDLDPAQRLAIAFTWAGDPEFSRLEAMGLAIMKALGPGVQSDNLLLLMIDGDIGKTIGRLLAYELDLKRKLISIDGVQLKELDFVDVGELLNPPGVVPVVIKSLLFS